MAISFVGKISVVLEIMMPALESAGLELLERHGQTIFPIYDGDGHVSKSSVFYIGEKGADQYDESQWTEFRFEVKNGR